MNVKIYADESGHSGKQIFNGSEFYYQCAVFIPEKEETVFRGFIDKWCDKLGVERLHAKDMKPKHRDLVFQELCGLMGKNKTLIHTVKMQKTFLPALKFVDSFFDPWENLGANKFWYMTEHFRHSLCLVIDDLLTDDEKKEFYFGYLKNDIPVYLEIIESLLDRIDRMPEMDRRLKEILYGTFEWALKNIDKMTINHVESKSSYKGNTPNLIAFTAMLHNTMRICSENDLKIEKLVHDEQSEFAQAMRENQKLFGDKFLENVPSLFPKISKERIDVEYFNLHSSKGEELLQITDLFLWHKAKGKAEDIGVQDDYQISRNISEAIVQSNMNYLASRKFSKAELRRGAELLSKVN